LTRPSFGDRQFHLGSGAGDNGATAFFSRLKNLHVPAVDTSTAGMTGSVADAALQPDDTRTDFRL